MRGTDGRVSRADRPALLCVFPLAVRPIDSSPLLVRAVRMCVPNPHSSMAAWRVGGQGRAAATSPQRRVLEGEGHGDGRDNEQREERWSTLLTKRTELTCARQKKTEQGIL